ncbi:MAG: hypothetical protein QOG95_2131, partial [Mycobacterium sp.]|nr:hypothetical protein [Mycobacterium sp.]
MSFMMFPPEVNSSLMYSGAGSGPLMAAASAWDEVAADLESAAASYQAVLAELTGTSWLGPSSARMAAATTPYVDWLAGTAGQAAQTSAQARFAAAAYESAFAGTIPPAVIAANRALLAALVATNFLGQNTPAIAATEALYMEMWFQDGLTMDTYATISQQAVVLPQQTPAPSASDGGTSANAAAAAQSTANSASSTGTNLATALQNLFPSLSSNSTSGNGLSSAASTALPAATTSALSSDASTVPPAVIAANRALLVALVATNFLGQNSPAIAATEMHYLEMWFQDGLTMDTYALTSQQAVVLPQQTPAPSTSDGGTSANAAAATQAATNTATNSSTNLMTALQNLAPSLTTNSSGTSGNGLSSASVLAAP